MPDCSLTPGEVGEGRPHPFMMFECAKRLGVYPMAAIAKVGDTPADIHEGINAGSWSIGVAGTGNAIGLVQAEFDGLSHREKEERLDRARRELRDAGAHYVIDSFVQLGLVLDEIDARLLAASRSAAPDKLLFTPGPLTTSATVKLAMLHDAGSRDQEFMHTVRSIRERLLALGAASPANRAMSASPCRAAAPSLSNPSSPRIPREGKLLAPGEWRLRTPYRADGARPRHRNRNVDAPRKRTNLAREPSRTGWRPRPASLTLRWSTAKQLLASINPFRSHRRGGSPGGRCLHRRRH